ncbi:probable diacyglycerol O-acyltransferase tgs1 [Montipora capricornis]|uniref:probable diacyglycerol O-acyltransferase tgs1 n=1 Tax=Montipora capricornis TaxID=246305 RepID=UPI0035F190E3
MKNDAALNELLEDSNDNINANSPKTERKEYTQTRSHTTTQKKTCIGCISSFVSSVWFIIQCILCHVLLLVFTLPILPFMLLFFLLKTVERVIVTKTSDKIPLAPMDAVFLTDAGAEQMIINSVICFENKGTFEEGVQKLRDAIEERFVDARKDFGVPLYPRVRCFIRPGYFQYFFEEDHSFAIDNHVFPWKGKIPSSKDELEAIVSMLSNEPLPEGRSPWYCCCIPTNFGDNDFAVMFRVHHAMADGVSLIRFLIHQLPDNATIQRGLQNYSSTGRVLLLAKAALIAPRYLFKLQFKSSDNSILHGPELNWKRKITWNEPIDLKFIKEIKDATGTTVNDVLMSCMALALRRYFQRKGVENPDDFTVALPVDVRAKATSQKLDLENRFSFIFPELPVATEGALDQLYETKARMDRAKISGEPLAAASVFSLSGKVNPQFLNAKTNSTLSRKLSGVLSNVRGPQEMLSVRGVRIKYLVFWPPQKENLGVTLSILTYTGKVFVGVQGDTAVLSDPEVLLEEFGKAVNELTKCIPHTSGCVNEEPESLWHESSV